MRGTSTRDRDRRAELSLHADLPVVECAHRLRGAVDEPAWALFSLSGYVGSKAVIGTVGSTEIRLQQRSKIRHPWAAVLLDAKLLPDHSGTRIEGQFRRRRSQTIFMGLWTTFAVVVGGVLFVSAVLEVVAPAGRMSGNPWVGMAIPLVFWTAAALHFWQSRRERRFLAKFVRETVGAKAMARPATSNITVQQTGARGARPGC
jgi:hypothetical protein